MLRTAVNVVQIKKNCGDGEYDRQRHSDWYYSLQRWH
jgi:hypothetical protein